MRMETEHLRLVIGHVGQGIASLALRMHDTWEWICLFLKRLSGDVQAGGLLPVMLC